MVKVCGKFQWPPAAVAGLGNYLNLYLLRSYLEENLDIKEVGHSGAPIEMLFNHFIMLDYHISSFSTKEFTL